MLGGGAHLLPVRGQPACIEKGVMREYQVSFFTFFFVGKAA
jgi:membrane protein YqaA with SNARE-associated domain